MKHKIDPKVDCVFKAILGAEENRNLLIHFLNAILYDELPAPISHVDILNPYNDKEFLNDKLSIVDVKARDDVGRLYQIEIQLVVNAYLADRIAYNWADIYSQQLQSGKNYLTLKPTYAIWLLAENLIEADDRYVHNFKLRDTSGNSLNDHGGIWLLELNKFHAQNVDTEDKRWLKFFNEGGQLNNEMLPDWMITTEMRQAMNTLTVFSEKEHQYDRYQARQEYIRVQSTIQEELERAMREKVAAIKSADEAKQQADNAKQRAETESQRAEIELQRAEIESQRADAALLEIEQLKAMLAQATKH
jgi:predicted transposase/invertase (TIGR01784 family)